MSEGLNDGAAVRGAIEAAEGTYGFVREDAKALLAVTFITLVIRPLRRAGDVQESDILEDVRHDISLLLSDAAAHTVAQPDPPGICAHAVIDALSRRWEELRSDRRGLWDD